MGFQLVPKSVTLNDLEQYNGRYFVFVIILNTAALEASYVKVVEDTPYCL